MVKENIQVVFPSNVCGLPEVTLSEYRDDSSFIQREYEGSYDVLYDDTEWTHSYKFEDVPAFETIEQVVRYEVGCYLAGDIEHIEGFSPKVQVLKKDGNKEHPGLAPYVLTTDNHIPLANMVYDIIKGATFNEAYKNLGEVIVDGK